MTTLSRRILAKVSRERRVPVADILRKCRKPKVYFARVDAAKRLDAAGYHVAKIARILRHDHTAISYYLGNIEKKRPPPEPPWIKRPRWRAPRVQHLEWLMPPRRARQRYYLRPYAGADFREYRWIERPRAS